MATPRCRQVTLFNHFAEFAVVVPLAENEQRHAALDQRLILRGFEGFSDLRGEGLCSLGDVGQCVFAHIAQYQEVCRFRFIGGGARHAEPPVFVGQLGPLSS